LTGLWIEGRRLLYDDKQVNVAREICLVVFMDGSDFLAELNQDSQARIEVERWREFLTSV
jgi:hypothetical protein